MSWWRAARFGGSATLRATAESCSELWSSGNLGGMFGKGAGPPTRTDQFSTGPFVFHEFSRKIYHSNRAINTTENRNSAITTTNKSRWNSVESICITISSIRKDNRNRQSETHDEHQSQNQHHLSPIDRLIIP